MSTETAETTETTAPETTAEVVAETGKRKRVGKRGKRGPNIPDTKFVEVYNSKDTREEVLAEFHKLGFSLTYGALISRAGTYKDAGIDLKELDRKKTTGRKGNRLADRVADLNKLAAEVIAAKAITTPPETEGGESPQA